MTTFARGVAKTVAINPETSLGVVAGGAGQLLRRTSSDLNLSVQQVTSSEILTSQQMRDSRNGPRQVQGTLAGQLSCTSYTPLFENLMRSAFAAVAPITALTDTSATLDGNGNLVVASASANFSSRFKAGDIVRPSGLTGAAVADNGDDCRVIALTGSTLTLSPPVSGVAWVSGQTDTFTLPGKKLIIPGSGQTNKSFSVEHWYGDIGQSELFVGCKVTQLSINVPASGFVTMQASITGVNMLSTNTQVFPGAAAQTTTTGLTATGGKIGYAGKTVAYITALSVQIAAAVSADPVVGSNIVPEIFLGTLSVRGSISAFTAADTMTADFLNEAEFSLSVVMTTDPSEGAEFMSIHLPRVKLTSSTKNDSDKAITRSFAFVALENTGTILGADLTSIMIQDSLAT